MITDQTGLVLEGGGLRGLFTAGVLDFFVEQNIHFSYHIGVSAGAVMGTSYISRQVGRNKRTTLNYVNNPKYLSFRNFLQEGSLFGMDFIFNQLPNRFEPFDYDTFFKDPGVFKIGATNCDTGRIEFFEKSGCSKEELMKRLIASSSIPFFSPIFKINGSSFLDGGVSDPIPIEQSIKDGNSKNVIILTQNQEYRKRPFKPQFLANIKYRKYPLLAESLLNRHRKYNDTLKKIEELEKNHQAFVIRPLQPLKVGRMEKNTKKLEELYNEGLKTAEQQIETLKNWTR